MSTKIAGILAFALGKISRARPWVYLGCEPLWTVWQRKLPYIFPFFLFLFPVFFSPSSCIGNATAVIFIYLHQLCMMVRMRPVPWPTACSTPVDGAGCLYLGDSVRASVDATFRNKSTHTDYFLLNATFIHISCFVFVLVFALSSCTMLYCGDILAFNLHIALKRALHPMWKECIGCSNQGWTIFFKLRKMLIIK